MNYMYQIFTKYLGWSSTCKCCHKDKTRHCNIYDEDGEYWAPGRPGEEGCYGSSSKRDHWTCGSWSCRKLRITTFC